jgi:hypothetical protein
MKRINIKLDIPEATIAYYRLQDQWENEGGSIPVKSKEDLIPGDKLPFSPGDTFRVAACSIDLIDDAFYYIVDIDLLKKANAVPVEHDES